LKFTLVIDAVKTPQEIVNALGCVAGQVLLTGKLSTGLADGPQNGVLVDATGKPAGCWDLS
jgi:hypothetical protein